MKENKLKKVAEGAYAIRYQNYIICDPSATYGDTGNFIPIYIYDEKKMMTLTLTARSGGYDLINGKIYYSDCIDESRENMWEDETFVDYRILTYDLSSKEKDVLVDSIRASYTEKFTTKGVYCYWFDSGRSTEYFYYSFEEHEITEMNSEDYYELVRL